MGFLSIIGGFFSGGLSLLVNALAWLAKNPVIMAIVICATAFALLLISKNGEIRAVKNQLAMAGAQHDRDVGDLTTARANETRMSVALDQQTASLQALQQKAAEQNALWQKLVITTQATDARMDKQLSIAKNYKPGPDMCASAEAMIRSAVQ